MSIDHLTKNNFITGLFSLYLQVIKNLSGRVKLIGNSTRRSNHFETIMILRNYRKQNIRTSRKNENLVLSREINLSNSLSPNPKRKGN